MSKKIDKQTLTWLAAIFESKPGRISMDKKRGPRIQIQTTSEALAKELGRLCGGAVTLRREACPSWCRESHNHRRNSTWSWECWGPRTALLVKALDKHFRLPDQSDVIDQILAWEPKYGGSLNKAREELRRKGWNV